MARQLAMTCDSRCVGDREKISSTSREEKGTELLAWKKVKRSLKVNETVTVRHEYGCCNEA